MSAAKTATKRKGIGEQNDLNVGNLNMGHWSTREMRRPKASTKSKGRATRKAHKPPLGGWTGGN